MGKTIGITGTPGTGKKTIAPVVASRLGLPCISLNDLASAHGLTREGEPDSDVDTSALGQIFRREHRMPSVVFGHLLPNVLRRSDVSRVIVLRCEPSELRRRLVARGYPPDKVIANVEAELIGLVAMEAYSSFGTDKTAEFDASGSRSAPTVSSIVKSLGREGPSRRVIDWLPSYDSAPRLNALLSGTGKSALT